MHHAFRRIDRLGDRHLAWCACGWSTSPRRTRRIARLALAAHMTQETTQQENTMTATESPLALAVPDTLRSAELPDLISLLRSQQDLRYDVVAEAQNVRYAGGLLVVKDGAMRLDGEGVSAADALLRPTVGCEDQIGDRLEIPTKYVRKMRADAIAQIDGAPDLLPGASSLLDHSVNHWLDREPRRKFLIRAFRTDDPDEIGMARAFLSDRYGAIDNLDVLMAGLDGVRRAGVKVDIEGCDLSDSRMSVRIACPEVQALAPVLLANYNSPFGEDRPGAGLARIRGIAAAEGMGYAPGTEPVVFAGFVLSNSETGGGAFTITPRVIVKICRNGLTIKGDALRAIHLGGRLDEGLIRWSAETQQKAIELITAKATDAVATFLDAEYVAKVVARMEEQAGAPVAGSAPEAVERVSKHFGFSKAEQDAILVAFISSGQATAGGMLNAVTAAAQTVGDPDRAADLEAAGLDVLAFAAAG